LERRGQVTRLRIAPDQKGVGRRRSARFGRFLLVRHSRRGVLLAGSHPPQKHSAALFENCQPAITPTCTELVRRSRSPANCVSVAKLRRTLLKSNISRHAERFIRLASVGANRRSATARRNPRRATNNRGSIPRSACQRRIAISPCQACCRCWNSEGQAPHDVGRGPQANQPRAEAALAETEGRKVVGDGELFR
jgi:hypothetical protein